MSFALASKFKQTSDFRPLFNVGCLMDIQTGRYVTGIKGEHILNGGVAAIEGITGPGNSMKSTLAHARLLRVLQRYNQSMAFAYDTENSSTRLRYQDLGKVLDPSGALSASLEEDVGRFVFTDAREYDGTDWYAALKDAVTARLKEDKMIDTPFLNKRTGKPIQIYAPIIGEIDSFSQFRTKAVMKKAENGNVGESDLNTVAMQNANGKSQVLDDLPNLTGKGGLCMILTAHMGDIIVMDQYNGPKKKLAFVKATRKMKKVPESFTFLTNNLFEITELKPLLNQGTKEVEFPRNEEDDMKGNTDLMVATVLPIRTKSGTTGIPFELLFSQSKGLQISLTEYWYCKSFDRYGLAGNLVQQRLTIYPDVVFTRKNIRRVIDEDPRFCRALEITSELCQMQNLWPDYAVEHMPTIDELYEKLKAKGYDWNELLDTRGYWTFDQYTNPIPFLSTKDLIEMYHDRYTPFWYKKAA